MVKDRILIGSRAARAWWRYEPMFNSAHSDWDFISMIPPGCMADIPPKHEYHFTHEFLLGHEILFKNSYRLGYEGWTASPDFLYTLKVSHSFWNIHWSKTINHIRMMKFLGCKLNMELFDLFYPTWVRVHGAKHVNLNIANEQFFTHYVDRQIDHDMLHEHFKTGDRPKYQILKKDPSKALISKSMFFEQSYEEQLNTVREEMCVLAAERYYLPGLTRSPGAAARSALKLLITSASKGWFPLFIVDNWDKVLEGNLPFKMKELIDE